MKDPKFLIVQYANGSAGKFLSNLLMASRSVAHFDPDVEANKTDQACLEYTKHHFVKDIDQWLIHEPKHTEAWNLHHVSTNYPRGDNLTKLEFLAAAEQNATPHFLTSVDQGKTIPFVWHKLSVPEFFESAIFVTIIIDAAAVKWFHRARWYKQYGIVDNSIHIKEQDPKYNNASLKKYYNQFKNPYRVQQHPYSFIKQNILRAPLKKLFSSKDAFQNSSVNREFVNLSEILDLDQCVDRVNYLCNRLNLEPISSQLIIDSQKHWASCHNFKYSVW